MKTAWFGEPKLKQMAIERLIGHRRLDQFSQGTYFEDGKGCHLGCLTHCNVNSQQATERMFGIPERVAYWMEAVFEGLPSDKCDQWVLDSISAIPVGANMHLAHHHFGIWLLPDSGLLLITDINRDAIAQVVKCHELSVSGKVADWSAAALSAELAAGAARAALSAQLVSGWPSGPAQLAERSALSAARSAAGSASASAQLAARSSGLAVRSAALSARSLTESAESAESAAWCKIASKSIEIFASCPIAACDLCMQSIEQSMAQFGGQMMFADGQY